MTVQNYSTQILVVALKNWVGKNLGPTGGLRRPIINCFDFSFIVLILFLGRGKIPFTLICLSLWT